MPGWKPQFQRDAGTFHSLCWGSLRWHSPGRAQSLQRCRSWAGTEPDTIQGSVPPTRALLTASGAGDGHGGNSRAQSRAVSDPCSPEAGDLLQRDGFCSVDCPQCSCCCPVPTRNSLSSRTPGMYIPQRIVCLHLSCWRMKQGAKGCAALIHLSTEVNAVSSWSCGDPRGTEDACEGTQV